ncbi:hypothetical protein [Pseudomonas palleroniana]|uniref:hypothetical protein n=1 Tax=Pseudomonas palleroniana TaxID=191390 RepID=UPI001FD33570|nr:hypothetical protein [Pseudomonas palleroniana]UOP10178.1 hypothetical protein LDL65_24325 [Pseudomonas palleroniana]
MSFAFVVVALRLEGGLRVYVVVSAIAALIAGTWMFGVVFFFISKVEDYQVIRNMFPVFLSFLLGGVSVGLTAYWFLPKKRGVGSEV